MRRLRTSARAATAALIVAALGASGLIAAPAHAAKRSVGCQGLQAALNASNAGDVITLTKMCTGKSFVLPSRRITLRGANGAGFDGTGAPSMLLTGMDVSTTVIRDLIFRDATGNWDGNAIHIGGNNSSPRILNSTFRNNGTIAGAGGAIYAQSLVTGGPGIVLANNTFGGSSASAGNLGGHGGAAYLVSDGPLTVRNNVFRNNRADGSGGALRLLASNAAPLVLSGNDFIDNVAQREGGAVYLHQTGNATITGNVFRGNRLDEGTSSVANRLGGALYAFLNHPTGATVTTTQSNNVFSGNSVDQAGIQGSGGALYLQPRTGLTLTSRGDRIVRNRTNGAGLGGGLALAPASLSGDVKARLVDSVVAGNRVGGAGGAGGGIYTALQCMAECSGRLEVVNTTVAGNRVGAGDDGSQLHLYPAFQVAVDNSIVYGDGSDTDNYHGAADVRSSDMCASSGTPVTGPGNICKGPRLKDAADGDVHQTRRSPTRDKGSNSLVPSGLKADFEGHGRILDSNNDGTKRVDMGADELRSKPRISISIGSGSVKVSGAVKPKNPRKKVVVKLARRSGGRFRTLGTKRDRLNRRSRYAVMFADPAPGTCRVKVVFKGSNTTLAGSRTKRFSC